MQHTTNNRRNVARVLVSALVLTAWFGAACSSRMSPPNLPPPEYEEPRPFSPPVASSQAEPSPEPPSAPALSSADAPAGSDSAAPTPAPSGDAGAEAR